MDGSLNKLTVVELLDRGANLHCTGDFLSAEFVYNQILLEQPNHPEANHNLAIVLIVQGNLDGAVKHLKTCLNANPNVNLFWATYIDVLIKLERKSEAKKLLITAKENGLWHPSMRGPRRSLLPGSCESAHSAQKQGGQPMYHVLQILNS